MGNYTRPTNVLRTIADGQITARETVHAYHDELKKLKLKPIRPLKEDAQSTEGTVLC